jgi:hypothetical protein
MLNLKHVGFTLVLQIVFLRQIFFSENSLSCVKTPVVYPALHNQVLKATFYSTEKFSEVSLI